VQAVIKLFFWSPLTHRYMPKNRQQIKVVCYHSLAVGKGLKAIFEQR
jgi:hypothetical protein